MKWSWPLIILLAVPLLFNVPLLETLRLKTFDRLVDVPNPTGYFTILNITEEYIDSQGGYPLPRKTLADIHIKGLNYLNKNKKSFILNCGYGKGYSVKEIINIYSKLINNVKIEYKKRRAGDVAQVYSNTKSRKNNLRYTL